MTPEMNWDNLDIDQVGPISLFGISKNEELGETFCWKFTQPFLKKDHQHKGIKFYFSDYQLQFIKEYQFIKLIEEGFIEELH